MTPWHHTAPARRIIASLTAADLHLNVHTPVIGPKSYYWTAGEKSEALAAIRKASLEREFGTFDEAYARDGAKALMAAHDATPTVADVLAELLGEPPVLGSYDDVVSRQMAKEQVEAWDARRVRGIAA